MIGNIQAIEVQIPHEVGQYWGWFLVSGIGLLALGIAAVVRSVLATVATMLFFGWLLVLASGIEMAQAAISLYERGGRQAATTLLDHSLSRLFA